MRQPAKVTQMIPIMEPSWIETISMDRNDQRDQLFEIGSSVLTPSCPNDRTNLGRIAGGSIHKIRGIKQILTLRGALFMTLFIAAHLLSQLRFFCSPDGRKEAIRVLTKPRSLQARRQSQSG